MCGVNSWRWRRKGRKIIKNPSRRDNITSGSTGKANQCTSSSAGGDAISEWSKSASLPGSPYSTVRPRQASSDSFPSLKKTHLIPAKQVPRRPTSKKVSSKTHQVKISFPDPRRRPCDGMVSSKIHQGKILFPDPRHRPCDGKVSPRSSASTVRRDSLTEDQPEPTSKISLKFSITSDNFFFRNLNMVRILPQWFNSSQLHLTSWDGEQMQLCSVNYPTVFSVLFIFKIQEQEKKKKTIPDARI